jgi:hypothetical protein
MEITKKNKPVHKSSCNETVQWHLNMTSREWQRYLNWTTKKGAAFGAP